MRPTTLKDGIKKQRKQHFSSCYFTPLQACSHGVTAIHPENEYAFNVKSLNKEKTSNNDKNFMAHPLVKKEHFKVCPVLS